MSGKPTRLNLQAAFGAEAVRSRDTNDWATYWSQSCKCSHQRRRHSKGLCTATRCQCRGFRKPKAKAKGKAKR